MPNELHIRRINARGAELKAAAADVAVMVDQQGLAAHRASVEIRPMNSSP